MLKPHQIYQKNTEGFYKMDEFLENIFAFAKAYNFEIVMPDWVVKNKEIESIKIDFKNQRIVFDEILYQDNKN